MKIEKPPIGILPKYLTKLGPEERIAEIFEAIDRYLTAKVCPPIRWLKELDELIQEVRAKEMSYLELIGLNIQVFERIFNSNPDKVIFNDLGKWKLFMKEYNDTFPNRQVVELLGINIFFEPTSPCFYVLPEVEDINRQFKFKRQLYFICGKNSTTVDGAFYGIELDERLPNVMSPGRQINIGYTICKLLNKSIFRQCTLIENYNEIVNSMEATCGNYAKHVYEQQWRGQISEVTNQLPPPSEEYYHNKLVKQLAVEESVINDFGFHKFLMDIVGKDESIVACDEPTFKEWLDK